MKISPSPAIALNKATATTAPETAATVTEATTAPETAATTTAASETAAAPETATAAPETATAAPETAAPPTVSVNRQLRNISVDSFLTENENVNTKRKANNDIKLFQSFLNHKNECRNIENIPSEDLCTLTCKFKLGVTKKYEPTTLRGLLSSIDRYLKATGSKLSFANDIEFFKVRQVLKSKQKSLKRRIW